MEPPDCVFVPLEASVHDEMVDVGEAVIDTELVKLAVTVCVDAPAVPATAHTASIRIAPAITFFTFCDPLEARPESISSCKECIGAGLGARDG
jgi:hypothetical protein